MSQYLTIIAAFLVTVAVCPTLRAERALPEPAKRAAELGLQAANQQEWQEAIKHFREAKRLAPRDAQSHLRLAMAYDMTRRDISAIASYEAYLALAPRAADTADIRERIEKLGVDAEDRVKELVWLAHDTALSAGSIQNVDELYLRTFLERCERAGEANAAEEVLESLSEHEERDGFLLYAVRGQCARGDIERARKTANAIKAFDMQTAAYKEIVEAIIAAGEYDSAARLIKDRSNWNWASNEKSVKDVRAAFRLATLPQLATALAKSGDLKQAAKLVGQLPDWPTKKTAWPLPFDSHSGALIELKNAGVAFADAGDADTAIAIGKRLMDEDSGNYGRLFSVMQPTRWGQDVIHRTLEHAYFLGGVARAAELASKADVDWKQGTGLNGVATLMAQSGSTNRSVEVLNLTQSLPDPMTRASRGLALHAVRELGKGNRFVSEYKTVCKELLEHRAYSSAIEIAQDPRMKNVKSGQLLAIAAHMELNGESERASRTINLIENETLRRKAARLLEIARMDDPVGALAEHMANSKWLATTGDFVAPTLIAPLLAKSGRHADAKAIADMIVVDDDAAQCWGLIIAAQFQRGEIGLSRQSLDYVLRTRCGERGKSYWLLAREISKVKDVAALRTIAAHMSERLPFSNERQWHFAIAQLQRRAWDSKGGQATRDRSDGLTKLRPKRQMTFLIDGHKSRHITERAWRWSVLADRFYVEERRIPSMAIDNSTIYMLNGEIDQLQKGLDAVHACRHR